MFTSQHKQTSALAGPVNHLLFVLSTYSAEAGAGHRQSAGGAESYISAAPYHTNIVSVTPPPFTTLNLTVKTLDKKHLRNNRRLTTRG